MTFDTTIPRCSYPITRRRTCGVELRGIYRYCPEHLVKTAYQSPIGTTNAEIATEYANYYAGEADELEKR
jgi:hypothetical protein